MAEGLRTGHKLTVISAPAGFGKTTLLSEWVTGCTGEMRVAWLSLDEGDNDLAQFLAYLVAATRTVVLVLGDYHHITADSVHHALLFYLIICLYACT